MDTLTSFIFDTLPIRGVMVKLNTVTQKILSQNQYPHSIEKLISEALIAVLCLFSLSKESGKMTLQFQGNGLVKLLSARCTFDRKLRALAQWEGEITASHSFRDLLGEGHIVLTYQPDSCLDMFQSIIPLSGDSLSESIENYFTQSDQIKTYLHIASSHQEASGLMLQLMPDQSSEKQEESFNYVSILAKTLKDSELLEDPPAKILFKLFNQDQDTLRVFEPQALYFGCGCSLEKMQNAVKSMGLEEAKKLLQEKNYIQVKCDFCGSTYDFTEDEVEKIYGDCS